MRQNVQPGKADSRFHHVRLHTVKRRKTSGCKKKKQKWNPCPRLFLWGNKKLPDQVLSRVGGEESWGAKGEHFTIIQKEPETVVMPLARPSCPLLTSLMFSSYFFPLRTGEGRGRELDPLPSGYTARKLSNMVRASQQLQEVSSGVFLMMIYSWAEGPHPLSALKRQLLNIPRNGKFREKA